MKENWYESFVVDHALASALDEAEKVQRKVEAAYEAWKEERKRLLLLEILAVLVEADSQEQALLRLARLVTLFTNGLEYANRSFGEYRRPVIKL